MIKELKPRIKELLEDNSEYRDSDSALMARIWYDDFKKIELRESYKTSLNFLFSLKNGELTNWDSATRCRRKIQEEYVHLRGKNYVNRQENLTEVVKDEIRQMSLT